jgi:Spy/CpxP family protein refolding chaperone
MLRTVPAAAAAAVLAASALVAVAAPAQAANGTVGVRETVCAQDLYVRTQPLGAWMGTLSQGQTFLVEQLDGSWVYGFAYGQINRHGWVQDGWFC